MTGMTSRGDRRLPRHHLTSPAAPTPCSPTTPSPHPPDQPRLPPRVNNLAIQALLAAFAAGKAIVNESSARAAVTEVTTDEPPADTLNTKPRRPPACGTLYIRNRAQQQ